MSQTPSAGTEGTRTPRPPPGLPPGTVGNMPPMPPPPPMTTGRAQRQLPTPLALGGLSPNAPRVGGILGGYAWTGGSALASQARTRPVSSLGYRPPEFKHAFTIEQAATKGLPETKYLCKEEKSSKISLTLWIDAVRVYMEEHGMDSVFRVKLSLETSELYMLSDWGSVSKEKVEQ